MGRGIGERENERTNSTFNFLRFPLLGEAAAESIALPFLLRIGSAVIKRDSWFYPRCFSGIKSQLVPYIGYICPSNLFLQMTPQEVCALSHL